MEKQTTEKQTSEEQPKWWQFFIYYDPNDHRTFVPKRMGIGYTLNFARPVSKAIVLGLLIAIILHLLAVI